MRRTSELAEQMALAGRFVRRGAFAGFVVVVAFALSLVMATSPRDARAQYINPYSPTFQTSATWTIAATGATDAACIVGSASGSTRVIRITIDGTAAAAGTAYLSLTMRSSLDTGGTSANSPLVSRDSNDAAPHATVPIYSVQPTALGTAIGIVDSRQVIFGVAAAAVSPTPTVFDFSEGKPVAINGAAQELCLTVAAAQAGFIPHMTVVLQGN